MYKQFSWLVYYFYYFYIDYKSLTRIVKISINDKFLLKLNGLAIESKLKLKKSYQLLEYNCVSNPFYWFVIRSPRFLVFVFAFIYRVFAFLMVISSLQLRYFIWFVKKRLIWFSNNPNMWKVVENVDDLVIKMPRWTFLIK